MMKNIAGENHVKGIPGILNLLGSHLAEINPDLLLGGPLLSDGKHVGTEVERLSDRLFLIF